MMSSFQEPSASADMWDTLHSDSRFRPRYPSEDVVRFLVGAFPEETRSAKHSLDIGVGGGRHVHLMCEMGFDVAGCDISEVALRHTREWLSESRCEADLRVGSMLDLPFDAAAFDAAVAFGVFYYGDGSDYAQAVAELHRVLRPGGQALVVTRATDDYRFGKGQDLGEDTWRILIEDTNEYGSVQHFLSESAVPRVFSAFSSVDFEKTTTSRLQRAAMDSNWIVRLVK